jgi:tetratricopeptide (TPR) repeat protein
MKRLQLLSLLLFVLYASLRAQNVQTLTVDGGVELEDGSSAKGVRVVLYNEGKAIESMVTSKSDGSFSFKLELNKVYKIEASKPRMCTKFIEFDTHVQSTEKWKLTQAFSFYLFELCDGMDLSVLNDPIVKIHHNSQNGYFEEDKAYNAVMRPKLDDLMQRLDKCRNKDYQAIIDKADALFKNNEFAEATKLYKEAQDIDPDDKYVKNQLSEIQKITKKQNNDSKRFEDLVKRADDAFAKKQSDEALNLYKQAAIVKPSDTHIAERISQIEANQKQLAQQNEAKKAEAEEYKKLVANADQTFKDGKTDEALKLYREALTKHPDDLSVKQRIETLEQQIAKTQKNLLDQKQKQADFNRLMTDGDRYLGLNQLDMASESYRKAHEIFPDNPEVERKFKEIDARRTEKERQFKQLVFDNLSQGNQRVKELKFDDAKNYYNKVLELDPNNKEAKTGLELCNNKIAEQQAKDLKAQNTQRDYQTKVAEADKLFGQKEYEQALTTYQNAQKILPAEPYPGTKINEINQILQARKQAEADANARRNQYDQFVRKGDKAFNQDKLSDAETAYRSAVELLPDEKYPSEQLNRITEIRKKQQEESAYKEAINQADMAFKSADYVKAREIYNQALTHKANDSYVTEQLKKIDQIEAQKLQKQQLAEKQYKEYITTADAHFTGGRFTEAKAAYQSALNIKPSDDYATKRIAETDKALADQEKKLAEEKLRKEKEALEAKAQKEKYDNLVANADKAFNSGDYVKAKEGYNQALSQKTDDLYVQGQIKKIEQIEAQKVEKQQLAEKQYKEFITTADAHFTGGRFTEAKAAYQSALNIKPSDDYATKRIAETDKALADQEKKLAEEKLRKEKEALEAKAQKEKYDNLIAGADKAFNSGDYTSAANLYKNALTANPGQLYPTSKLTEIDRILAARKLDSDYSAAIADADNLFKSGQLETASSKYSAALLLKPAENYPKQKINEINDKLKKLENEKNQKLQQKAQYDACIARADQYFKDGRYDNARSEYENAGNILPDETYPRQRIAKIKELKELLAQQSKQKDEEKTQVKEEKKIEDLKFNTEEERSAYLKKLKETYPVGVTKEAYKESRRTVNRYVIIRDNVAHDYREVRYNWGGVEFFVDGKSINSMYFNQQINTRSGEKLYEK